MYVCTVHMVQIQSYQWKSTWKHSSAQKFQFNQSPTGRIFAEQTNVQNVAQKKPLYDTKASSTTINLLFLIRTIAVDASKRDSVLDECDHPSEPPHRRGLEKSAQKWATEFSKLGSNERGRGHCLPVFVSFAWFDWRTWMGPLFLLARLHKSPWSPRLIGYRSGETSPSTHLPSTYQPSTSPWQSNLGQRLVTF